MSENTSLTPLRVLVVDGDSHNLSELWAGLEPAGHRICGWASGQAEGLELACRIRPDAVLVDVELPEGDGIELAAQLFQAGIGPVLMIATEVRPDLARRAADAGVFAYLVRPVEARKLVASLDIAHGLWTSIQEPARRLEKARKRLETREIVGRAKKELMSSCGYGESEAYRYMQELSMYTRKPMREVAETIVATNGGRRPESATCLSSRLHRRGSLSGSVFD
jgi:response regulator NasT